MTAVRVLVCLGFALSIASSAADEPLSPHVSRSIVPPLKAAQNAIRARHYDEALGDVKQAQAISSERSTYDDFVVNVLLIQIYQGKNDPADLIQPLAAAAQSQYATAEQKNLWYGIIARYEYGRREYHKAIDAARQAIQLDGNDNDMKALLVVAEERARIEQRFKIQERIQATTPHRRNGPLRYLNISDDEVREIQAAAAAYSTPEFVSIGGVVTGCPEEEGPACTDQVWVDLHRPDRTDKTLGLLLSKVNNQWSVSVIQRWWLCKADLEARQKSFSSYGAYLDAQNALVDHFPSCATQ